MTIPATYIKLNNSNNNYIYFIHTKLIITVIINYNNGFIPHARFRIILSDVHITHTLPHTYITYWSSFSHINNAHINNK